MFGKFRFPAFAAMVAALVTIPLFLSSCTETSARGEPLRGSPSGATSVPSLHQAMAASAADLARSYDGTRMVLTILQFVKSGLTVVTEGQSINQDNVDEVRLMMEDRLAVYETAIQKRGYRTISGRYHTEATSSCTRVPSWAMMISDDRPMDIEISQVGFEIQMNQKFSHEGEEFTIEMSGTVVESVLTFRDEMNSDFIFLGEIGANEIKIYPDTDAVLASWPSWANPPSRKDLVACVVTLSRMSK